MVMQFSFSRHLIRFVTGSVDGCETDDIQINRDLALCPITFSTSSPRERAGGSQLDI